MLLYDLASGRVCVAVNKCLIWKGGGGDASKDNMLIIRSKDALERRGGGVLPG